MKQPAVHTSATGRVAVVCPEGEIDMATAPALRAALLDTSNVELVVVDLRHVTFMDSTGIAALVAGRNRLEANGGSLCAINASGMTERTLRIVGVLQALTPASDLLSNEEVRYLLA